MSLEPDYLIDRRRLKRRVTWWRLVAVLAIAGLVLLVVQKSVTLTRKAHVARISIEGLITEDRARDKALRQVARNDKARALIVYVSSPGGTVVGGETLYKRLRAVAKKKPVVAVMGTLATSGGYMTALGADRIFARDGTITGSIGVILQTTDVTGLLDKFGVKAEAIKSGPLKAAPSPLEPMTDQVRAATRAVVLDMYDQFVDMVMARRNLDPERAKTLTDGRVFSGRQALEAGLVDAIGGEEEARAWLAEEHDVPRSLPVYDVTIERESDSLVSRLRTMLGKAVFSERLSLDGLVSVWQPE